MSASAITPDIAKSFSWSPDIKTQTIELREGHKWSDGHPFTVDDIIFWWEDVQLNEELRPGGPRGVFKPGGELAEFKKISDTVLGDVVLSATSAGHGLSGSSEEKCRPLHDATQALPGEMAHRLQPRTPTSWLKTKDSTIGPKPLPHITTANGNLTPISQPSGLGSPKRNNPGTEYSSSATRISTTWIPRVINCHTSTG